MREDNHLIDYDKLAAQALDVKPKLIIAGGSAYPRTLDFKRFREIADSVGAYLMVDMAHFAGLVPEASIPIRWNTRMWSPPPPTRPCAARAAA